MKLVSADPSSCSLDPLHLGFPRRSSPASPDSHFFLPFVLAPPLFIQNSWISYMFFSWKKNGDMSGPRKFGRQVLLSRVESCQEKERAHFVDGTYCFFFF